MSSFELRVELVFIRKYQRVDVPKLLVERAPHQSANSSRTVVARLCAVFPKNGGNERK